MSFLKGLFQRRATPSVPVTAAVDPFEGDTAAHEWSERLGRGEWAELGAFLRSFEDVETRDFYINMLAENLSGRPSWLDVWVGQEADDALPRLFRGWHSITWAWAARGGGGAETVSGEGWGRFFERLHSAEDDLQTAARLGSADAGPWVALLAVARGLQQGQERQRELFTEAQRRRPWHQGACTYLVRGLTAKWGGSNDQMLAFARDILREAPEGAGAYSAVAEAHLESYLELDCPEDYWQRPEVRDEIMTAANRSIYSPRYTATPRDLRNRNMFAYCFAQMDDGEKVLEQMSVIGDAVTYPWTVFTRPVVLFEIARRRAQAQREKATAGATPA